MPTIKGKISINVRGTWYTVIGCQVNVNGTWKTVTRVDVNINGTWKLAHEA